MVSTDTTEDVHDYQRYCDLETLGIKDNPYEQDAASADAYKSYCDTHLHYDGSRYIAKLPWKMNHESLPTNYNVCVKRTRSTIQRLTPDLRHVYNEIIHDQIERGFIEEVLNDDNTCGHYLPHRAVKRDSTTTPIRIVYDCSCKVGDSPSLNDCLEIGPSLQNDLPAILVRFRLHDQAFTADIEKAFLNVSLAQEDRKFTKFLWVSDINDPNSDFCVYQFKVVLFGAASSPFILNATVRSHLEKNDDLPTSRDMRENIYVDNVASGTSSIEEAVDYYKTSRGLMNAAGFNLRSWTSNCQEVVDCAKADEVSSDPTANVLGLLWDSSRDTLQCAKWSYEHSESETLVTKRVVSSAISSVYDPLGYVNPVHIKGKIFLQELWKRKLSWDEPIPNNLAKLWTLIALELEEASKSCEIPRKLFMSHCAKEEPCELHVFAYASMKAYGAVAYLVCGSEVSIVMAKSRVSPLKEITMPRLELMATLIGSRLLAYLHRSLKSYINIKHCVLWSDSQIVVSWLHSDKPLPTFVANRVKEICSYSAIDEFRYCPSAENPADIITRGLSVAKYRNSSLWWNGPHWLCSGDWPDNVDHIVDFKEVESEHVATVNDTEEPFDITNVVDLDRFSSYTKLLRVSALVLRFVSNLHKSDQLRTVGPLTAVEIQQAELVWIKAIQSRSYKAEFVALKSKSVKQPLVKQLRLFIGENDVLRVGGRLHNSELAEEAKFPILIPSKHRFAQLIILDAHSTVLHAGMQSTIVQIRHRFWMTNIRQRVKSLLRDCVICKRVMGKPFRSPIPAPLQAKRLLMAPPFTISGVDFTGALLIRGEGGSLSKAYVCLFTCAVTRCIHLEIVTDMSVVSFVRAFRRFAARRSIPREMISDNATTFLAAADELKTYFANHRVKWTFIKKRAAWYGGFYERLIGLTKSVLKKVLGRSFLNLEELQTVISEVEAVLNDRPITFQSTEVGDLVPLTPSHFLHGRVLTVSNMPLFDLDLDELQDPSFGLSTSVMQRRVQRMAKLQAEFWKRWSHEYLSALRERDRGVGQGIVHNQIKVGDVVLIHEDNQPRLKWRMGRVVELHYGNDGLIRSVALKTSTGLTNRPITKLYHLESSNIPITNEPNEIPIASAHRDTVRPSRQAAIVARDKIADILKY